MFFLAGFLLFFLNLNNFPLPVLNNSNCKTKEAIYILIRKKCNCFYIGETGDWRSRFSSHLSGINRFKPYVEFTPVSHRFNLKEHDHSRDLAFAIFKTEELETRSKRRNIETPIIHLFRCVGMKLLNDDMPSVYSIRNI
jgi:hypothetical protein